MTVAIATDPWNHLGAPELPFARSTPEQPESTFPPRLLFASYTPDGAQTNGEANRRSIQALLDFAEQLPGGAVVALRIRGVCWIDKRLLIGDNTGFDVGYGVDLRIVDNANDPLTGCGVLGNKAAFLTEAQGTTVTSANITWGTAPDGFSTAAVVTNASIGARHPVGSYVSAVITGHLTSVAAAQQGGYFRGVWKVLQSNTSGIQYEINKRNVPGSGRPDSTAIFYRANVNITISGEGTINGNGIGNALAANDPNGRTLGTGNPRGVVCWFRHVFGLTVRDVNFKRGRSWTFGTNYVRNFKVIYPKADLHDPAGSAAIDFFHLSGHHQQADIWLSDVYPGDNGVGMTMDQGDQPTAPGFPANDFEFQEPGDMWNIHVHKCNSNTVNSRGGSFAGVAFWGSPGYKFFSPVVENVTGATGVSIQNYAPTVLNDTVIDKLVLRNIAPVSGGAGLIISGIHTIESLELDGVQLMAQAGSGGPAFNNTAGGGAATVGKFAIKNIVARATSAVGSLGVPAATFLNMNIGELEIESCENLPMAAGIAAFAHTGTGTIGKVTITKASAISLASGTGALWSSVGSTGLVGSISFSRAEYTGVSSTGNMFIEGAGANYPNVLFSAGCRVNAAAGFFGGGNVGVNPVNVFMSDMLLGAGCAQAGVFAGNTNLFLNGYAELGAPTNLPFQTLTAARQYNFRMENVGRDTDSINKTAGTLRLHGLGARTDGVKVDAPQPGDVFWNTNAGTLGGIGLKGRTAAAAWANVF